MPESKSSNVDRALSRPIDYAFLSACRQREIDFKLGLLDWNPTPEEIDEYESRWRERYL